MDDRTRVKSKFTDLNAKPFFISFFTPERHEKQ